MRGNLPTREPETVAKWEKEDLYGQLMKKNADKPKFVLHDGPPYANGDIHMGHALNKVLKDIIIKHKNMSGYCAPYVPGWDTHGLPIERQAIKKLGINRHAVTPVEFRQSCREFALKYVENQKGQFKRLGVIGDWDNPYLTLKNEFVAKQVEVFGEMAKKGLIYRGLKPVYWCYDCETALAEAEIEYAEDKTNSIYVKFVVEDDLGKFAGIDNVYFVIWTTTTWTLPANVAICLNKDFEYSLVKVGNEVLVMASELIDSVCKAAGISEYEVVKTFQGSELEGMKCAHPFLPRQSQVILGDHVTLEAGTGCVHTAPGHGVEDYIACQKYPEIPIVVPVDAKGYLTKEAGEFEGVFFEDANAKIIEKLKSTNHLLAVEEIIHQYPHCWRCGKPILFRATEQWFASVDAFKDLAVDCIHKVKWLPAWGEDRIVNMVRDRHDWCISRQRTWGVPIPIFYCKDCGKPIINDETIQKISAVFREHGADAWWGMETKDLIPEGLTCECGCHEFTQEKDIMDVWFDSGSSHLAVCDQRPELKWPADIYLEGNDQYRGWFQSSLLTSVATRGEAPYKTVITHGFVIDENAQKMSKSKGNALSPLKICDKMGADILRLWVVASDYKSDIKISDNVLKQLTDGYKKIRNTCRYILSNISDFDPKTDMVAYGDMTELDKWALYKLNRLVEKAQSAYDNYEYHTLYHAAHNFCVLDMSSFYMDILKDRLYAEKADGVLRRSAQTALYIILDTLVRLLAPVISFTAEEIWTFMPHTADHDPKSVFFNDMPVVNTEWEDKALADKWDEIALVRNDVLKALETARVDKLIGKSLEADVTVYAKGHVLETLTAMKDVLATVFITSGACVKEESEASENAMSGEVVKVTVAKDSHKQCERCWIYSETVGQDPKHETLCKRCIDVIEG